MCGGSAGFVNNRSDFDSSISLTYQVKQSVTAYDGRLYNLCVRGDESVFATVGLPQPASTGTRPVIKLWRSDCKPLQAYAGYSAHEGFIHSLSFLDSSSLLASCAASLCVYDYEKKTVLSSVAASSPFTCMTTSSGSITAKGVAGSSAWQQIYCSTRGNDLLCYDLRQKFYDLRVSADFPLPTADAQPEHPVAICALAACEDLYIALAWTNGVVRILSQRVGSPIFEWHAHTHPIAKLAFIGTKKLLTACVDGSISVWDLTASGTPSLSARFVNMNAIKNARTLSVVDFATGLDVFAAVGDTMMFCNDVDLREYDTTGGETVHMYTMNGNALCDGITSMPLTKLNLCVNAICPLRRIALCGSDDGKLYVVQSRIC